MKSVKWLWRSLLLGLLFLVLYFLLEPGDRYLFYRNIGDGRDIGRLYYHNGIFSRPLWLGYDYEWRLETADLSPDGSLVLILHNGTFYTYRPLTAQMTPIGYASSNTNFAQNIRWSPDGSRIGFICSLEAVTADICIFDIQSQSVTVLTDYQGQEGFAVPFFGSWGPDNDTILYLLSTDPDVAETVDTLKVIHARSRQQETVLEEKGINLAFSRDPVLSPDGKTVLFSAAAVENGQYANEAIYQVDIDGSDLHLVAVMDGFRLTNPVWNPDGRSFYATATSDSNLKPVRFNLDGERISGFLFQNRRVLITWRDTK
jgi:Tol biopolymer transport system component